MSRQRSDSVPATFLFRCILLEDFCIVFFIFLRCSNCQLDIKSCFLFLVFAFQFTISIRFLVSFGEEWVDMPALELFSIETKGSHFGIDHLIQSFYFPHLVVSDRTRW
jgi:hypothetical protein